MADLSATEPIGSIVAIAENETNPTAFRFPKTKRTALPAFPHPMKVIKKAKAGGKKGDRHLARCSHKPIPF